LDCGVKPLAQHRLRRGSVCGKEWSVKTFSHPVIAEFAQSHLRNRKRHSVKNVTSTPPMPSPQTRPIRRRCCARGLTPQSKVVPLANIPAPSSVSFAFTHQNPFSGWLRIRNFYRGKMIEITVSLPESLDARLVIRATEEGFQSKEEYLVALVKEDCSHAVLEETLLSRYDGPFAPLEADWKERVRQAARARL